MLYRTRRTGLIICFFSHRFFSKYLIDSFLKEYFAWILVNKIFSVNGNILIDNRKIIMIAFVNSLQVIIVKQNKANFVFGLFIVHLFASRTNKKLIKRWLYLLKYPSIYSILIWFHLNGVWSACTHSTKNTCHFWRRLLFFCWKI